MPRWLVPPLAVAAALVFAASASAHATLSPAVVTVGSTQMFTLAVPTEKEGATTTQIEMTPPAGFAIDSFVAANGWSRTTDQSGSGEDVVVRKATWKGGKVPTGEAAAFQFVGHPDKAQRYAFKVRQTYSDGTVVDWTGGESAEEPAPSVEAQSSLGGGSNTLSIVSFVIATVALVLAAIALLLKAGEGRELA
jgi:uncharacterized protein YcnI